MIREVIIGVLNVLVLPRDSKDWVSRLIIWCAFSTGCLVVAKFALGMKVQFERDLLLMSLAVIPIFVGFMSLARHWESEHSKLDRIASTDSLTGMMNRRAFFGAVERADEGAMLLVDVDHFKSVNDRFGHTAGDEVLVAMASHLARNVRSTDILGRLGGEEFGIFLVGADSSEVDAIGERICKGFVMYNDAVTVPIKVTVSIGAAFSAMAKDLGELFDNADEALYAAKHSGRARLNFWQPPMSSRS